MQVGLPEVQREEAAVTAPEAQRSIHQPQVGQAALEGVGQGFTDGDVRLREHRGVGPPGAVGHPQAPHEGAHVDQVHRGLQGAGRRGALTHAGGRPDLVLRVGVGERDEPRQHALGPGHGPRDLAPEVRHPLAVQRELGVVLGVGRRPVAMHRRGHVVAEEGAEVGTGPLDVRHEDVEGQDGLEGPTAGAPVLPDALGGQLDDNFPVGRRPDPEPARGGDQSRRLAPGEGGVDVATRRAGHREVEGLEPRQHPGMRPVIDCERVGKVEGVGVEVVGSRGGVERPAHPDARAVRAQQLPHRREGTVGRRVVLPESADPVPFVGDAPVHRGPGSPR